MTGRQALALVLGGLIAIVISSAFGGGAERPHDRIGRESCLEHGGRWFSGTADGLPVAVCMEGP